MIIFFVIVFLDYFHARTLMADFSGLHTKKNRSFPFRFCAAKTYFVTKRFASKINRGVAMYVKCKYRIMTAFKNTLLVHLEEKDKKSISTSTQLYNIYLLP